MTLTVTQLYKHIDQQPVIAGIDMSLPLGQIVGLVGRNGAGKTTLMRLLANEMLPERGEITGANDIFYLDVPHNFMANFSLKQLANILPITYPAFDSDYYWQMIQTHHLSQHKAIQSFSKGQRALVYIITALASKSAYILLDEPLDGLDVLIRDAVKTLLIEHVSTHATTILIASHNLVELDALVDRILFMKSGKIWRDYAPDTDNQFVKLQLVLSGETLPPELAERVHVIEQRGHVWVVLCENYDATMDEIVQHSGLQYFEELPVSTEDVFRATFKEEEGV
jgi:ABC-2 type transport system ATP-binding protein